VRETGISALSEFQKKAKGPSQEHHSQDRILKMHVHGHPIDQTKKPLAIYLSATAVEAASGISVGVEKDA
jgi:hypothetical protein